MIGGVVGAQFGTGLGARLKSEQLRILLAVMVMIVAAKVGLDLTIDPVEHYNLSEFLG